MRVERQLKLLGNIVKILSGMFLTIGGLAALTGYGLSLPYFRQLGGFQISLLAAAFFTVIGMTFVFTGLGGWVDCYVPRRVRLTRILKDEVKEAALPPEGLKAAETLLAVVENAPTEDQAVDH